MLFHRNSDTSVNSPILNFIMYSKKYNTPELWLLYPMNPEVRDYSDISFASGHKTASVAGLSTQFPK